MCRVVSYTLLLLHAPAGASDEDVEQIANAVTDTDDGRAAPRSADADRRKRALVDALLAECPELSASEPDYAALAEAEHITEQQARDRFRWWTVSTPEDGSGIEITLYDDHVSLDMPSAAGTDQDWEDIWHYLEILVREGGFVVWDPQGSHLVDLASGPFGDGSRTKRAVAPQPRTERQTRPRARAADDDDEDDDGDVEPEDVRRGGEIATLINRIVDDAIAQPLAAAGFKRSGRTWRRVLDNGLVHVVEVRWSPRDRGVEGLFGLAAGVYSRALAESLALYKPTSSPKEHDCQVRLRPGAGGRNYWRVRVPGKATPEPDVPGLLGRMFDWLDRRADRKAPNEHAKAGRELRETLERHVLPTFEQLTTLRGVRDHLAAGPDQFWAAHASVLIGERDEAKRLLNRALEKATKNPEFSEVVRRWGRQQELL
jgi:hypothetical protein